MCMMYRLCIDIIFAIIDIWIYFTLELTLITFLKRRMSTLCSFIYLYFQISPWMKNAEQVIILTCGHISGYHITRYQNDSPDIFLKALRTSNFNYPVLSELLEQPNTVRGIPAGGLWSYHYLIWFAMNRIYRFLHLSACAH